MGPLRPCLRLPPHSTHSSRNSEPRIPLDSSTPLDYWRTLTRRNSSAYDSLRSSTDVFPCLPFWETSSPVLESIFLEPSTGPVIPLTPFLTVGLRSVPSPSWPLPADHLCGLLRNWCNEGCHWRERVCWRLQKRLDRLRMGTFDEETKLFKRGVELNN